MEKFKDYFIIFWIHLSAIVEKFKDYLIIFQIQINVIVKKSKDYSIIYQLHIIAIHSNFVFLKLNSRKAQLKTATVLSDCN